MEDVCPEKECNGSGELLVSSTSNKLPLNQIQQMDQYKFCLISIPLHTFVRPNVVWEKQVQSFT